MVIQVEGGSCQVEPTDDGGLHAFALSCDGGDPHACVRLLRRVVSMGAEQGKKVWITVDAGDVRLVSEYERMGWKKKFHVMEKS